MSACACIHSCISGRDVLSTADIDMILKFGDRLYLRLRPLDTHHRHALCFAEELSLLSDGIQVGNHLAKISIDWKNNGLYPNSPNMDAELNNLEATLRDDVFNADHSDATDSYLFTGLGNTTSFWRHNNEYYYFNSHGVDIWNEWHFDRHTEYLARFFRCSSVKALAKLLLKKLPLQWESIDKIPQYTIDKIALVSSEIKMPTHRIPMVSLERLSASKLNEVIGKDHTLDPKFTTLKPVVVLERLPIAELSAKDIAQYSSDLKLSYLKPTVVLAPLTADTWTMDVEIVEKKPRGRPRTQKRGPNVTVKNASSNAVQKYAKKNPRVLKEAVKRYYIQNRNEIIAAVTRHTQENPEIHRDAVNRYSQQNPEVNRAASQRYHKHNRHVDSSLTDSTKLIGQRCDDELNTINTFSLKKTSLLGSDIYKCDHCKAPLFEEEKTRVKWCCGGGGIYKTQEYAPLTEDFYTDRSFLQRSRAYNHLFAFSALGTTHGFQNVDAGISFVKVQGRIYHRVFDLSYTGSTNPIGLYIEDSSERERIATGQSLNTDVVRSISHYLHQVNPYIDCFKRLSRETSEQAHLIFDTRSSRSRDGNILGDRPVGNEIAAIISTETERYVPRCIVIWKIGGSKPHTVDLMNKLYESFQYPLLYPNGELGWTIGIKDNRGEKLAQVKYVRCLLLCESRFSQLGRLSEEWLVDMQCRILEERLKYIHSMQSKRNDAGGGLRVAPLEEIISDETIQGEGGIVPGRIYLPCTFTGSDRYMKKNYLDAIGLLNRLGSPSFFLTMTCNPKWPEIQQSTPAGQNPSPIMCARVFQLKLLELLRDVRRGLYFGECVYVLHVIEFQKRGLPHAHIAFRVEGGGPVVNVDIDSFIRADIPKPTEANGKLRAAVLKHMIHGPCGLNYRTDLQCWDGELKKCTRYFPKKETEVTYCDDRGFTHLRRDSKNEASIKYRNREVIVNDLWVAPYNAALLLKYDCHINLEATSARAMIKYLFKYITKGVDKARVALVSEELRNNEIETYVTKRYVGSCDAAWRVFEFDIVGRTPTVYQLPVHLSNQQAVFFHSNNADHAAERSGSLLLTYFARPPGEKFDRMTYIDFHENFLDHASRPKNMQGVEILQLSNGRFITPRQRGHAVARMFWVAPNRGEQFYLRVLLSAYPCRSYDDLIRLGGADCTTFQEAARAVGMADDESEYIRAMQEASTFMTAPRLRHFIVMLAVNGIPVASLWDTFKDQLSEDFINRLGSELVNRAHEKSLVVISRLLRKHGSSLRDQGLPEVHDDTTELGREYTEYDQEHLDRFVQEWLPKLSVDQRAVYDYVHELVTNDEFRAQNNNAIFVDCPAGTGKTLLLNLITSHVRGDLRGVVLCTASSGIAAQNYPNGMTAHSMFKFPIDLVDDLGHWSVTKRSQRGELIRQADVIIYDEAPMAHKYLIHMLDRSLRDLMDSEEIFGGKLVIFAGDFRQIPPVVINAQTDSDVINCSVKSSPLWNKLKTFSLTTSQRQTDDSEFAQFLLKLGSNQLPAEKVKVGRTFQNLIDLSAIAHVATLSDLIDFVFPFAVLEEPDICAGRAILSTHNAGVKEINNMMMSRLANGEMHFFSVDSVVSEGSDELFFGNDALNRLQPNGVPEYDLVLKVGCVCMVTRNLSFADGLLNGTKVIVVAATPSLIKVRKPNKTEDYLIPRISFKAPIDRRSPIEMMRRQFPLQVCYAMSIHKSQGQTINRVGVDLRSDVFSHGQLYVALGRVQSRNDIKILTHPARISNNRFMANNIVYPQLL
jgi:Cdc6-like AAA superfamily ATPase